MRKVPALYVSPLPTPDQKRTKMIISQENLILFVTDAANFLEHILMQDACWPHHFERETKRQFMQWKHPSSPVFKKAKIVSALYDEKGIVFIQKGHTINEEYYANMLKQF